MINKRGFEFSFGWMFAIIVGAAILFLAIYAVTQIVENQRKVFDTQQAKQLDIILHPLETGIESGKISQIEFRELTRLYVKCNAPQGVETEKYFGSQEVSIATSSGIGKEWGPPGKAIKVYNKYIFSGSTIEDKKILVFSKPLYLPYKVADVLYLISFTDKYCFVNPPSLIKEELGDLTRNNEDMRRMIILNASSPSECEKGRIKVCFSGSGCDIEINLDAKSIRKYKQRIYYEDDKENTFLYGAIFSDPGIYECQIKRLMSRAAELADVYRLKELRVGGIGCGQNLQEPLMLYANISRTINSSIDLTKSIELANEIGRINENRKVCKIF